MLEAYKKAHEDCADAYIKENWRKMDKNVLVNRYVEVEENPVLADAYMSAIICRYWGAISKYYSSSYKSVDVQTCYEWLVQAILWAVQHKKWLEPGNKLQKDPNGPDKVINRCIASVRLGFFQSSNTHKRRQNFGLDSLEGIEESDTKTGLIPAFESEDLDEGTLSIRQLVDNAFDRKDYTTAFVVDNIINYDVFKASRDEAGVLHNTFNKKKLLRLLRAMNYQYSKNFACLYNKPLDSVNQAVQECTSLSRTRLKTAVDRSMRNLVKHYTKVLEEY